MVVVIVVGVFSRHIRTHQMNVSAFAMGGNKLFFVALVVVVVDGGTRGNNEQYGWKIQTIEHFTVFYLPYRLVCIFGDKRTKNWRCQCIAARMP